MKIFPSEKFEINTGMTREEVVSRLQNVIGKRKLMAFRREKPFEGWVSGNEFKIRYIGITSYSQAFAEILATVYLHHVPNIDGKLVNIRGEFRHFDATEMVSVKMSLITSIKMFLTIWIVMGLLWIALFMLMFFGEYDFFWLSFILFPLMLMMAGYWVVWSIFKRSAKMIKGLLMAILQKQEREN